MTKQLLPNQHPPLHFLYGHDDCCLCRTEERIHELEIENRQLKEEKQSTCIWHEEEWAWESNCGLTWTFIDDGPEENGLRYCPKCGKIVTIISGYLNDEDNEWDIE
jgi:hypothetical protein